MAYVLSMFVNIWTLKNLKKVLKKYFLEIWKYQISVFKRFENIKIREECLTLFPTAPPSENGLSECNYFLHNQWYIYIYNSDPKGFFPSFKTLDLAANHSQKRDNLDAISFERNQNRTEAVLKPFNATDNINLYASITKHKVCINVFELKIGKIKFPPIRLWETDT